MLHLALQQYDGLHAGYALPRASYCGDDAWLWSRPATLSIGWSIMRPPGKKVADEFYIHVSALEDVDDQVVRSKIQSALDAMPIDAGEGPNVAKYNFRTGRVALLRYPHFFDDPFPALARSWVFQDRTENPLSTRSYIDSLNPPILHRKELLVGERHPSFSAWAELTATAESVGLFDDTTTIGFALNWKRLLRQKGLTIVGNALVSIGNDIPSEDSLEDLAEDGVICRHLTALTRTTLSAPVQLLQRHGFLSSGQTFFDYGCGRGGDINALRDAGVPSAGWDPYFRANEPLREADVVNLGFVVNVIEDPAERIEALVKAFSLARVLLCVSVMLHTSSIGGTPYSDGVLTSRKTFQKYFTQAEFRDYIEHALSREAFVVGPGIAFVFATLDAEQRFVTTRYRRRGLGRSLVAVDRARSSPVRYQARPVVNLRQTRPQLRLAEKTAILTQLWETTLEFGRYPYADEVPDLTNVIDKFGTLNRALRDLKNHFDSALLDTSSRVRAEELCLALAIQQFSKRAPYRHLEQRLQRDIKAFFGNYQAAQEAGRHLLQEAANPTAILEACRQASGSGIGYLDGTHSLQLHLSLVERLPAVLRLYVACGLILWDSLSEVQLIKIHIGSGKLSLMEYEDFDSSPLPRLSRRIKINLRKLDYDVFDYGGPEYPMPLLYRKSLYLHEEQLGYPEQLSFDESLDRLEISGTHGIALSGEVLGQELEARRLTIKGFRLEPSMSIPNLDAMCGTRLTYRALIECGETQQRLGLNNVPVNPATFNAMYKLATVLLDPIIDYYGPIRLTYGFASLALTKQIQRKIAPKLDQHAGCEHSANGGPICQRGGAACDFIVDDEDMLEVTQWIINHLPFDRLYYYGPDRPIHVSYSAEPARLAYIMTPIRGGKLIPRAFTKVKINS